MMYPWKAASRSDVRMQSSLVLSNSLSNTTMIDKRRASCRIELMFCSLGCKVLALITLEDVIRASRAGFHDTCFEIRM